MARLPKSFAEFGRDKIRKATQNAMEALAFNTVSQLQDAGPYWDGYFANAWEVKQGTTDIPATTKGPEKRGKEPSSRTLTSPIVPPADLRKGYTIGNSMEYRAIAMDLVPDSRGFRYERPGRTAPKDWWTGLIEGGELTRVNKTAAEKAFQQLFKEGKG